MTYADCVRNIYYDLYINNNLKNTFKNIEIKWIDPNDIINNENIVSDENNSYLENGNYSKKLTLDILHNGIYWPYVVSKNNYIYEGCHRIKSIKENYDVIWPKGKKVCCIVEEDALKKVRKYLNNNSNESIPLDNNIKTYFDKLNLNKPVDMWICEDKMYWNYLKEKIKESKDIYDTPLGKFHLIEINNKAHLLDCLIYMSIKLREDLFLYHNKNNMIYTCDELNDEFAFYKWKNSNFEKIIHCNKNNYESDFIYVNDIKINNLISCKNINHNYTILCKLDSNLLDTLDFNKDNILKINGNTINIKEIIRSSTTHFDDLGFVQVLSFNC